MFSKKPESTDRPSVSSMAAGSTFSVLGPDIVITGDLAAAADLHLDGKIKGDIRCAALAQGESSEVEERGLRAAALNREDRVEEDREDCRDEEAGAGGQRSADVG